MRSFLAACFVASLGLAGCAVNADRDDAETEADTTENAGALSTYGNKLVGAYSTDVGSADFDKIVLKGDGTYFTTKTIYCITTPCDPIRDEGKFIGYKPGPGAFLGGLRLVSKKGKSVYYRVSLGVAGESFKLSRDYGKFIPYTTVDTYCQAAADCGGQSYVTPRCLGYKTCESNKCGYRCGPEPTKCSLTDPTKRYIGTSKEKCMVIRYTCDFAAGETSFSNDCGCGCTVAPKPACKPSGCSGQICSDKDMISTCEWREQYACYQKLGICERGADGACGWRDTNELEACLESHL
jgi:hypothetical protein